MRRAIVLVLGCLALSFSARAVEPQGVNDAAIMAARPPQTLAEYRLFTDAGARNANQRVTPYELNTALYSDGALKFRYLYLPPNTRARYSADDVFDLPVGAVLVKTFAFAADMGQPHADVRYLETRLLIHRAEGWIALAYVWNEAQTEARLSLVGATIPTRFVNEQGADVALDWQVPNRNQCKGCHDRAGAIVPIGPTARNLNRQAPVSAAVVSQITQWSINGILDGAPHDATTLPRMPEAYDAESGPVAGRARAYLQVNCAHCHNPQGPAHTSGLDLRDSVNEPVLWGVHKRPVAAGRGSANMDFSIEPGRPERSILVHRMESTDPGVMMPELGRQLVDDRALALMQEWIAGMDAEGRSAER